MISKSDSVFLLDIIESLPNKDERIVALQIFINNYTALMMSFRATYRKELTKKQKNSKSVPRIHTSKSYQ